MKTTTTKKRLVIRSLLLCELVVSKLTEVVQGVPSAKARARTTLKKASVLVRQLLHAATLQWQDRHGRFPKSVSKSDGADRWIGVIHRLVGDDRPSRLATSLLHSVVQLLDDALYGVMCVALRSCNQLIRCRFTCEGSAVQRAVACAVASKLTASQRIGGALLRQPCPLSGSDTRFARITRSELAEFLISKGQVCLRCACSVQTHSIAYLLCLSVPFSLSGEAVRDFWRVASGNSQNDRAD